MGDGLFFKGYSVFWRMDAGFTGGRRATAVLFFFFLHMSAQSFKNHTFTPFCLESTADCNAERDGARA